MIKHIWRYWLWLSFAFSSLQSYAHSERCLELLEGLISPREYQSRTIVFQSIEQRFPSLYQEYLELRPDPIDYTAFLKEFKAREGRAPTLREAIEYSYEIRQTMHTGYQALIQKISSSQDPQLIFLRGELQQTLDALPKFHDLDRLQADIEQRLSHGEQLPVRSIDDEMSTEERDGRTWFEEDTYRFLREKTALGNYLGHYGEILTVLATKDRVISRGLRFDEPISTHNQTPFGREIAQRVLDLEQRLSSFNRHQLEVLVEDHSRENAGLLRFVKDYLEQEGPQAQEEIIREKILQAVKSKEIDMVSISSEERLIWSEIKAYLKPITVETLTRSGGKTLLDQLIEHRSVAVLLGYADEVQMRFYAPLTQVDREARELLQSIGFEVQ